MKRNVLMATTAVFCTAAICLCLVFGGCHTASVPDGSFETHNNKIPAVEPGCAQIGRDPGKIARLEYPIHATVTVYDADEGAAPSQVVELLPGTWLLPESAFYMSEKRRNEDAP